MKIDKIISMANDKVRLRFLAMERSLRETGCQLPLQVIPYDDNLFDLPAGSTWWEVPEITNWLNSEKAHPVMRKYQCLTVENYQFVDSDICFLRNPETVLAPHQGFVTSCGHWHNLEHTCTAASQHWISQKTTNWQRQVFNTGQFACDRTLYSVEELITTAMKPEFVETCVHWPHHEQPGLDWLVWLSGTEITNLTLPPFNMESTWAGDYAEDYNRYWLDPQRQPYLIHWAGTRMDIPRPINQIFYSFLTADEKAEWDAQTNAKSIQQRKKDRSIKRVAHRLKRALNTLVEA